jgi:carbamoyl-phosphate synthase large subunit
MKQIRILFLGGGKRVSLCQRFEVAARYLGLELKTYAYELNLDQPISKHAEVIVGKRWTDLGVLEDIRNHVVEKKIDLLVSCVDPATLIHAELSNELDAASLSSSKSVTELCLSKISFQKFCIENNLRIIPEAKSLEYPAFAKLDHGSASIGTKYLGNRHDLETLQNGKSYVIQKYILGTEFTVDAYVAKKGLVCGISPRIRIATSGGESTVTETKIDTEIVEFTRDVIRKLELIGPLTIQFIREESTGILYLMEVNPRFAGGVIASIEAGFDFPRMMLEEILGKEPLTLEFGKRLIMKRYFMEAFYATNN